MYFSEKSLLLTASCKHDFVEACFRNDLEQRTEQNAVSEEHDYFEDRLRQFFHKRMLGEEFFDS